tara:strand:- start:392 stop:688 length:297 start_codon:yes stop_codon:yes gene_type:complete
MSDQEMYSEAEELVGFLAYLARNDLKVLGDSLISLSVQHVISQRELKELQKILRKNGIKFKKNKKNSLKAEKQLINYGIRHAIETLKIIQEINAKGYH